MKQHNADFVQLVQDAKTRIQEIDIETTNTLLGKMIIIDVREPEEWDAGHLPNAIHLSKGIIERDIRQHVPDNHTPMIIYCGGGSRSALVADNLQKMGYTQVKSMAGGFRGWRAAGNMIVN